LHVSTQLRIKVQTGHLVLVLVAHQLVQREGDRLGERRRPGDALRLDHPGALDDPRVGVGICLILVGRELRDAQCDGPLEFRSGLGADTGGDPHRHGGRRRRGFDTEGGRDHRALQRRRIADRLPAAAERLNVEPHGRAVDLDRALQRRSAERQRTELVGSAD
jgi:hypothetical protein